MRQRIIATAFLIALAGPLAGCGSGLSGFDPSDMFDFLDTKKKLPGERKPVFPDGVPGLEQGVPKDLYRGAAERQQQEATAPVATASPEQASSKRSARSKGRTAPAAARSAPEIAPDDALVEDATPAAPAAPKPSKTARKRTTAPPPDQPQATRQAPAAQQQQPPQQAASPFPAPLPSGSFTR